MAKAAKNYDASNIKIFKGLDGVRKKPSMYLGDASTGAVNHMALEVIGNANDEAMNGHGKKIGFMYDDKHTVTVWDEGRGIPVGPHPDKQHKGTDTLTLILTELHAGGKMDDNAYEASAGVHGVGSSVVNALSSSFEVWSYRNKKWNYQAFAAGKPKTKVIAKNPPSLPAGVPAFKKQGTIIRYTPDWTCFDKGTTYEPQKTIDWINEVSWVLPVEYNIYQVKAGKVVNAKTIHRPNGMQERFKHECKIHKVEALGDPFIYNDKHLNVMIGWVASAESYITSAVSMQKTINHGTHLDGLIWALEDGFLEFVKKGEEYSKDSLKKGVVIVVNVNMHGPKFSSQDKVKLVSPEIKKAVYESILWKEDENGEGEWGPLYTYMKKNKDLVREVIERAAEMTRLNEEFKASADLAAKVKTSVRGRTLMPKGFCGSSTKNPEERELFIIEGDSAGGTAKKARFESHQEVFPLTGKIPNIWKLGPDKTFANQRVIDFLKVMGYDPKNPGKYRIGKLMLLTDSDVDGSHIEALILGLLAKVVPDMFEKGMVYSVNAPLYTYQRGNGEKVYGENVKDLVAKVGKGFNATNVTRLKGWGEASWQMLREVAFEPSTRSLTQITEINKGKGSKDKQRIIDMMGEDVAARKLMLGL